MSTLAAGIIESVPHELACACHQSLAIKASKKSSPASVRARPRTAILTKALAIVVLVVPLLAAIAGLPLLGIVGVQVGGCGDVAGRHCWAAIAGDWGGWWVYKLVARQFCDTKSDG